MVRIAEARTGSRQSEEDQARWSAHDFAAFCALVSVGYLLYYSAFSDAGLGVTVSMRLLGLVLHLAAVAWARVGRQLLPALLSIFTLMAQIVVGVTTLGWESGVHLYLIGAGVLVFLVFTERQAMWRWLVILMAGGTFVLCQTVLAPWSTSPLPESAISAMFSINAVLTALLVFALSGMSYYRAHQARTESTRNAARAEYLANTDALTGLSNRRPLMERLEHESAQGRGSYAVAIADLDHFKNLNDTYGHQCGDMALAHIAGVLRSRLRTTDAVGRWGGEEFIVVLPSTSIEHAARLMERLRIAVQQQHIPCVGHEHTLTVSIGVADGVDDGLSHRVVKRADDALYDAKTAGRNVVRARAHEPDASASSTRETTRADRTERR